jgi:hypothetical protein
MTIRLSIDEISDRVLRLAGGPVPKRPVDSFTVVFNDTTKGLTVSFRLADPTNIDSIILKRNFTQDVGSAVVVNTWAASTLKVGTTISYDDADRTIKENPSVFYWLECHPATDEFAETVIGPNSADLSFDQTAPNAIAEFDASKSAGAGGIVTIWVSFLPPRNDMRFGSCKIAIAGYNGIAATVEIAQHATSPFSFTLEQTGETVTLSAISVSQDGVESTAVAPTKVLTLNAAATVPAKIMGATATEIPSGLQIMFPAALESGITQYQIYRGRRGGGFGAAASIGTVTPTGASAYVFLDGSGLGGQFEWYVFAVNATGNGAGSDQILPDPASLTSADQTVNSPANQTNFAKVDSVDAGTDATIRIYDPSGGVGTAWTYKAGYGTLIIPAGSIPHKSYTTAYFIVWDTLGQQYLSFIDAPSTLPDNYIFAGKVTTVAAGGTGGSSGGGGTGGGSGGSGGNRFDLP